MPDAVAPAAPTRISREAGLRIALFVLVLLVAGGSAWGAGRLLNLSIDPASLHPHQQHHVGHDPGAGR